MKIHVIEITQYLGNYLKIRTLSIIIYFIENQRKYSKLKEKRTKIKYIFDIFDTSYTNTIDTEHLKSGLWQKDMSQYVN